MLSYQIKPYFLQKTSLFILCILSLYSSTLYATNQSNSKLILAVHPYLTPQELVKRFTPFAEYLSKEIGRKVEVRVGRTYEEHLQAICHNEVDIAFLGPAPYIKLSSKSQSQTLLAKFSLKKQEGYYGHIVTRENSGIKNISDLVDRSFAFGDPLSTMSHLIPRYMLQKKSIYLEDLSYSQYLFSHRNVAHSILSGDFDAGAVKHEIYKEFLTKGLREIAITPLIPPHLFVASNKIPTKLSNSIKQAMLKLNSMKNGAKILKAIHRQLNALVPVQDSDYNQLRKMLEELKIE